MRLVIPFRELDIGSVPDVGGKNASLGELLRSLEPNGIRVPDGFAVTAAAYRLHLARSALEEFVHRELDALDVRAVTELARVGHRIRESIRSADLPPEIEREIVEAYRQLSACYEEEETDVAVRSSAY